MVKRCVAAGCSNTYSMGVSLFLFPKDPVLRQKWTKNVQRTRAKWSGPTEHSVLCSQHFESSCFEPDADLASEMGLHKRRRLKVDAVPTLFERPGPQACQMSISDSGPSGSTLSRKRMPSSLSFTDASASKKTRSAYEKRERSRILSQLLPEPEETEETEEHQDDQLASDSPQSSSDVCDAEIQVAPDRKNARVQTSIKTKAVGKSTHHYLQEFIVIFVIVPGVQVNPRVCSVGVQSSCCVQDVGVQCSLISPAEDSSPEMFCSVFESSLSQSESESNFDTST